MNYLRNIPADTSSHHESLSIRFLFGKATGEVMEEPEGF